MSAGKVPENLQSLFAAARAARDNSYSPYSGHKVGAAVRTSTGAVFAGCNVENSSYGATTCAERVAIHAAVAAGGTPVLTDVLVVTDASPPWPPCGICRQVIAEFGEGVQIHAVSIKGELRSRSLKDLLPDAFTPAHLRK